MKKIVFSLFFFGFLVATAFGQDKEIRFGFQVSPTISFMNSDDKDINGNGANIGLHTGVLAEVYFRENYAFSTGIGFALNNGGTLKYNEEGRYWKSSDLPDGLDTLMPANSDLSFKIQYLEIPFGLKLRTREFGFMRYFMEPQMKLGIRTGAKGEVNAPGIEATDKVDIAKDVNFLAMSLGIGGGLEYYLSDTNAVEAGLFYQRVFTDVTNDVGDDSSKAGINNIVLKLAFLF